jgi:hypothetical protein
MIRNVELQTEEQFQDAVAAMAQHLGWKVAHFRPARAEMGWRTPAQYDAAGYPDLTMCRPPRIIFVEMKSQRGRIAPRQKVWLAALGQCAGIESYVWRPSDWQGIEQILARDVQQLTLTTNSTGAVWNVTTKGTNQ